MTLPRNFVPAPRINKFNKMVEDGNLIEATEHLLQNESLYNTRRPINSENLTKWAREVNFPTDADFKQFIKSVAELLHNESSTPAKTAESNRIREGIKSGIAQRPNSLHISELLANKASFSNSPEDNLPGGIWEQVIEHNTTQEKAHLAVAASGRPNPSARPLQAAEAAVDPEGKEGGSGRG